MVGWKGEEAEGGASAFKDEREGRNGEGRGQETPIAEEEGPRFAEEKLTTVH